VLDQPRCSVVEDLARITVCVVSLPLEGGERVKILYRLAISLGSLLVLLMAGGVLGRIGGPG